jgi:polyhydroxyalkanoate synthesis regulator phasin
MAESTYQFFTDEDFKKILNTQGDIQKDVAVAANNLNWIIENYKNQCKEMEQLRTEVDNLKTKYNDLKAEVWKYVGVGAGAVTAIYLFIAVFQFFRSGLGA